MASNVPPMPPAMGGPAPKKTSPVVWILGGCAVLVFLLVLSVTLGGLFIAHKVKQAGLDPELMQRHPEIAIVKMAVAANPDAEIVAIDENKGMVTVLDKKTGKKVTLNFEDIKNGKMSFEADGKKMVMEGHGQGDAGSFSVKTDEGTASFGAGSVKMPSWLPAYAAVNVQGFSSQTASGSAGGFSFKTADSPEKVIAFYKDAFKSAGLGTESMQYPGGMMLTGQAGGRKASIQITTEGANSTVTGTFEEK